MNKLSPQLTCTVKTYDLATIRSNVSPDGNFENIFKQLNERVIYLPGYSAALKHGDTFTVYGKKAEELKKVIDQLNDDGQGTMVVVGHYGIPTSANVGPWTLVSRGGGTASEISENQWEMTGPNDDSGAGWLYLKKNFPEGATITFGYTWDSSDDEGCCDWAIGYVSSNEPTDMPSQTSSDDGINPETPYEGEFSLTAAPGEWMVFGIYSDDSCCGPGYLNFMITEGQ